MLGNSITIEVQQVDILQLDSSSLAEQLTLIDHDLFKGKLSINLHLSIYLAFQQTDTHSIFLLLILLPILCSNYCKGTVAEEL